MSSQRVNIYNLIVLLFVVLYLASLTNSAPMMMTHQGRLTDNLGVSLSGSYSMTFRLFNDPSATDFLWEETQNVTVEDGLYSVILGSNVPLDISLMDTNPDSLYLEIQVGADAPLTPRTLLTSVPLASMSKSVIGEMSISQGVLTITDSLGDTTYILARTGDVQVEKHVFKQEFGPVQRISQSVNDSSGYISMSAVGQLDSSSTVISSTENRNVLKQYFETGDVPTEADLITTTDTSSLILRYDTLAEAVIEVTDIGPVIESGKEIETGVGISTILTPSGLELARGIREGGRTVGSGQLTSLNIDHFVMIDSLGDTLDWHSHTSNARYKWWVNKKMKESAVSTDEGAYYSLSWLEPDTSKQRKIEHGVDSLGSYLVMLDSLNDTTVIIEGSGGAIGGGRLVIIGADANTGVLPGNVEITDLDSDGTTDIRCDGNIGIGVSTPVNILEITQNSNTDPIADAWTTYSSRRWKKNINTIENALDKILKLRGVEYDWKVDGKHDIGLIAEEVGEIVPEVVVFEENGVDAKSVDYPRLVALLIEASKEQQSQISKLQKEINDLKALVTSLAEETPKENKSIYSKK